LDRGRRCPGDKERQVRYARVAPALHWIPAKWNRIVARMERSKIRGRGPALRFRSMRATEPQNAERSAMLAQQIFNALVLGSVYALFSMGFTLTFGVLRVINLLYGFYVAAGAFV